MTNELDPKKIAQLLTLSTRQLDEATLSALVNARQNALKRQSVRAPAFALTPASAHTSARWADRLMPHSAQPWIAAGLLAAILVSGTSYWQHVQEQQIDELDVAILTDDLPIEVFVD
jgi:Protein of unknown function (DUF3619)